MEESNNRRYRTFNPWAKIGNSGVNWGWCSFAPYHRKWRNSHQLQCLLVIFICHVTCQRSTWITITGTCLKRYKIICKKNYQNELYSILPIQSSANVLSVYLKRCHKRPFSWSFYCSRIRILVNSEKESGKPKFF